MDLSIDSDDRVVWRLAQENQMILLTANRSMKGFIRFYRQRNTLTGTDTGVLPLRVCGIFKGNWYYRDD